MAEKKTPISRRSFVKAALATLGIGIPTSAVAASGNASKPLAPLDAPEGDELVYLEATAGSDNVPLHLRQLDTTNNPAGLRITNEGSGLDIHSVNAGVVGAGAFAFMTTNGDGTAVTAGNAGYIDTAGKFRKATTDLDNVTWCVAITDAAAGEDVYVARRGRVKVQVDGSVSEGDYLVHSSTVGKARAESFMRPEVFAVCLTGDSGGMVDALLLTESNMIPVAATHDMIRINGAGNSDFVATINGTPSGTSVGYNEPTSGIDASIKPANAELGDELGKIMLHNTTRGNYALIQEVDVDANVITLTDTVPGNWADGDDITARSQLNTSSVLGAYFYDIEVVDPQIPEGAYIIDLVWHLFIDTDQKDQAGLLHPYEPSFISKRQLWGNQVADQNAVSGLFEVPFIDRKFQLFFRASGPGTLKYVALRVRGVRVKVP